ncbi:MAG: hypothetical protein ACYCYM_02680 [Saccharofermentanales bacterium]
MALDRYSRMTGFTGNTRAIFEQQNQKLCEEDLADGAAPARRGLSEL